MVWRCLQRTFPNKHDCLYRYPDNGRSQASIRWSMLRQHFGKALIIFPEVYVDQIKLLKTMWKPLQQLASQLARVRHPPQAGLKHPLLSAEHNGNPDNLCWTRGGRGCWTLLASQERWEETTQRQGCRQPSNASLCRTPVRKTSTPPPRPCHKTFAVLKC